jgi:hypothetical protein
MTCGAPAIASNTSSMPEILGDSEALFDPRDPAAMARMIEGLLANPYRRKRLGEANLHRARLFSWDSVAYRYIEATEGAMAKRLVDDATIRGHRRPRVAVFVPSPPESGPTARYASRMLPYWNRPFAIDVVGDAATALGDAGPSVGVVDPSALRDAGPLYACTVYHVGTAEIPDAVRVLLPDVPGVLVLHDTPAVVRPTDIVALRSHPATSWPLFADLSDDGAIARQRVALDAEATTIGGIVYHGRALRALMSGAQGLVFGSLQSATLLRAAWPEIMEIPFQVVEPAPQEDQVRDAGDSGASNGDARIASMCQRPARVAELETGAWAHVKVADDARSAESLRRELVERIAAEGWDESLSVAAGGAIEAGLALHPWSGRWMNRRA